MLVLTTEVIPNNMEIKEMYPMIELTYPIQINEKGLLDKLFSSKKNEHQEALNMFKEQAPSQSNAIIGVKASTATEKFGNGAFLYITYIGTPVSLKLR